jgi:hypothetical protein
VGTLGCYNRNTHQARVGPRDDLPEAQRVQSGVPELRRGSAPSSIGDLIMWPDLVGPWPESWPESEHRAQTPKEKQECEPVSLRELPAVVERGQPAPRPRP